MSPNSPSKMIATILILGGRVFGVLGASQVVYTLLDLRSPRRLVPADPSVAQAMANTTLQLSGGRTDMWRAWIGFNFSHSLGVLLVAGLALWAGFRFNTLPVGIIMPALTVIGCVYLVLALLYWVSCSRHRRCHWYLLLRRRLGSVTEVTCEGSGIVPLVGQHPENGEGVLLFCWLWKTACRRNRGPFRTSHSSREGQTV